MGKQSSENYLDQLLHSMNVKTNRSKDKQVQELEKEIESVKNTLRSRDEDSFYDELEAELENDEYKRFVSDFEAELEESGRMAKKVSAKTPKAEKIEEPEPELMPEPIPEPEPEPAANAERLLEEDLRALSLEELVMDEIEAEAIPIEEPMVQDLSGLSEEELDKLLAEESGFADIESMLSGEGNAELEKSLENFENFAENEMTGGVIEIGEDDDIDALMADASAPKKKESIFDKIKKLFSKKGKNADKVNLAAGTTDVNDLAKENQDILEAFEKAENGGAGGKKKEKKKKEKSKKEKKEKKEKKPKKERKPKEPKQPKPKKEKKPREKDNTPPLPKGPVALIWLMAVSVVALILVLTNLSSYSMNMKDAESLFDEGDYSEAYNKLNGLTIKEKDLMFYNRLMTLAPIDSEWDAYLVFAENDMQEEALDSLLCAAGRCEVNRESAVMCEAEAYINLFIEKISNELSEVYGITYNEALEIYDSFDREEYSVYMKRLLEERGIIIEE
uniref:hypothetical protein n=1 Tax=Agathobacter sp. TaxID=2021311 RepID=UPI0040575191